MRIWSWYMSSLVTSNISLEPLLGLDGQSERFDLINQLVISSPSSYMIKSQPYSSNCSYGKWSSDWGSIISRETRLWPLFNFKALRFGWNPPHDMNILADISLFQPRQMGILFGKFPTEIGLYGGWWSTDQQVKKDKKENMTNTNKNNK